MQVNGQKRVVRPGQTLQEFLTESGLEPARTAAELNGSIISRSDFDKTLLKTGDKLELVQFVGGG